MSPPPTASPSVPDRSRWFREEVHAHEAQLKAYLRSAYPTVADVDDVVQESYLRIWKARLTRPIASAKAFLFQIARHLAVDVVRHERALPIDRLRDLSALPVLDDRPTAAEALGYQEKVSLLADALTHLPARCREIFILRKFNQVPQREIAAKLGLSERTVESQITRGMKLLERYLRKHGVTAFARDER